MRHANRPRRALRAAAAVSVVLTFAACGDDEGADVSADTDDAVGVTAATTGSVATAATTASSATTASDGTVAVDDTDGVECTSSTPTTEVSPMVESEDFEGETRPFDGDNGTVEIPSDPERIVATGYAVPVLLEADADLVGISEWGRGTALMTDEDLAEYEAMTKVAGETAASTNYEAVANAQPDLIILGVPLPVLADVDMDRLESIAPVVVLGPSLPDSWKELSRRQADAAGELDDHEAARASYETKAAALADKYADVLDDHCFGHIGSYGDVSAGSFHREYEGSWGTNIATDIGVRYYGQPVDPGEGSAQVSEYPSIEELPASVAEATAITYSVDDDGTPPDAVQYVLDHDLWTTLAPVQDGLAIPIQYSAAATYATAERTLDAIDAAFEDAFAGELE
jgi:iron complex transport system substrate-binding protein